MTGKNAKTMLFATLIAAMSLPFAAMPVSSAESTTPNTDVLIEREWATSEKERNAHDAFIAYVKHDMPDNGWNKDILKQNIKLYNLETEIGRDVDGYELVALVAQKNKIFGSYFPTHAEKKLHDWALSQYKIPTTLEGIQERFREIVGNGNEDRSLAIVNILNHMANHGNVGGVVHASDPKFWSNVGVTSLCNYITVCGDMISDEVNPSGQLRLVNSAHKHTATAYVVYDPCETTNDTCTVFTYNHGSGPQEQTFNSPDHVQDEAVYASLTNYSNTANSVIVETKIVAPLAGGSVAGFDNDGYVIKTGNMNNPNAYAESYIEIKFTSNAW